jgi:hypothetical protein
MIYNLVHDTLAGWGGWAQSIYLYNDLYFNSMNVDEKLFLMGPDAPLMLQYFSFEERVNY